MHLVRTRRRSVLGGVGRGIPSGKVDSLPRNLDDNESAANMPALLVNGYVAPSPTYSLTSTGWGCVQWAPYDLTTLAMLDVLGGDVRRPICWGAVARPGNRALSQSGAKVPFSSVRSIGPLKGQRG